MRLLGRILYMFLFLYTYMSVLIRKALSLQRVEALIAESGSSLPSTLMIEIPGDLV